VIDMKINNIDEIIKKDDLYYCGSLNLKKFFENNGLVHISSYTKNKTKKNIYIYIKSKELENLLTIWSKNKGKRGDDNG